MHDVIGLVARIDADCLTGVAITDDPAVLLERAHEQATDLNLVDERLGGGLWLVVAHVSLICRLAGAG